MSKPIRIIQLSDCHVAADPAADYRGQNADRNLAAVLQAVKDWRPEALLLTGDVSEDASEASYQRVAELLATCQVPVLALPGNHDEPDVMRDHFPIGPWDGPKMVPMGNWHLVLLDSTERRRVSGVISDPSIQWLESELGSSGDTHHLVALHHQPVAVGANWIDRYCLERPEQLLNLMDQTASTRCVTWGHVHHDFRLMRKGVACLGAPSTVANSMPGTERFTLDPAGPACRWLELYPDGKVETGLILGAA
jgi:Icc protein